MVQTAGISARRATRTRVRPGSADGGSLAMALVFGIVAFGITALLLPVLLVQRGETRHVRERVEALAAAQSGLDVAVQMIRATGGDVNKLPCTPITTTDRPSEVRVTYFAEDPADRSASWLAANGATCPAAGTTPVFAHLSSSSRSGATNRTLTAVYTFRTRIPRIPGGQIHTITASVADPTTTPPQIVDRCLDAGSATPAAGTVLRVQTCVGGSRQQTFAYTTELTLVLVSSRTPSRPNGMCLQATRSAGTPVTLQPCQVPRVATQVWSYDNGQLFRGTPDAVTNGDFCFASSWPNTAAGSTGSPVVIDVGAGCDDGNPNRTALSPDPSVGAGAAGAAHKQLVNAEQAGRCLDVTHADVGRGFLVSWPCKQSPSAPAGLWWNQLWTTPATGSTGLIHTRAADAKNYCLRSPRTPYDPAAKAPYVTVVECSTTTPAGGNLAWTVNGDTGSYATSYTVRDADGRCLTANDPNGSDNFSDGHRVSKIVLAACSSSGRQKWNAPADFIGGHLRAFTEQ